MKSAWAALYDLWSKDETLVALLAEDAAGDPAIYPYMREDVQAVGDFPMITTPGVSGEDRANLTQGDVEISTWITVLTSASDPDGALHSIDEAMLDAAADTMESAHFFDGVRISVRTLGMREINESDRLRRRRIWTVGVA